MSRTPSEKLSSTMMDRMTEAINTMPAPALQLTLRMMVNLQRAEIKKSLSMSQSWNDICAVFVAIGYSKANPRTISRYYYGDPPKKLAIVKAALTHPSTKKDRGQRETNSEPDRTTTVGSTKQSGTGVPVTRGPIF